MLLGATALALLIAGLAAQQTFTVQNKPAAMLSKETTITIISSFWEIGQKKTVDTVKFVAAQKMLLKQKPANIRKWIARFYYADIILRWKRVYCSTIIAWVAHRYGRLYLLLINILLGSFQLFLHSDQLSEGEIIPFSGVCQSGRLHYPRRRQWWKATHWLTDCWCTATDDDQRQRQPQSMSFSALASANSFVYFASGAATSRWRICMSVIAAFAASVLWQFCRAGLCH